MPDSRLCLHGAPLQDPWLGGLGASPDQLGIFMALISLSRFTFRDEGTDRDISKYIKKEDAHMVGNLKKKKVQWMEIDGYSPGRLMLPSGGI